MCRFSLSFIHQLFNISPISSLVTKTRNHQKPIEESANKMETIKHTTLNINGINMHVAEKGEGPVILFIHGFPELWFSWRHQILALASLGYRAIAPDLRGYGDTDAPRSESSYTSFHIVGDLIGLLDAIVGENEKVYVVGHDWGAMIAWYLCLYRPDRVKALVNLSVAFNRRNPNRKPIASLKALYGDDYYICRFQEAGDIEGEFEKMGTLRVIREFMSYYSPQSLMLPKGKPFDHPLPSLPHWLSDEEIEYYVSKYEKKGFTAPINYYRNLDRNWELNAPFTGAQVQVPVKFIVGDLDLSYNSFGTKEYIHSGEMKKDVPFLQEVIIMEGVGHFIQEEKPHEISQHIYDFIKSF